MYFRKYRLRKTWLHKGLKNRDSEEASTDNMANGSKHCSNRTTAPLPYLSITVKVITLEKFAFSDIQNPETVCQHIDCR